MKIAIMQPYFFPYVGYFSLIKHTDMFILFDPVQFIRHGWIERNRVLKQNEGWLYVQVPLIKASRDVLIKDTLIDNTKDWKSKIIAQLQPYKKIAPHYFKVIKLINEIFEEDYQSIVYLNKAVLEKTCQYLGMEKKFPIFSEMNMVIEEPQAPDEWALNICKAMGTGVTYWNPPGGMDFFNKSKYDQAGVDLKFQKVNLSEYNQKRTPFEAGLSIIDIMMFNTPEEINVMLDQYELV